MKKSHGRKFWSLLAGATICGSVGSVFAAPTATEALKLAPVQKEVDFDRPTAEEIAKCSVKAETLSKLRGFVVYDGNQQILRRFLDTNGDNSIDQWCYFRDGVEVYRDIDSDSNGKADQYRWLGTAGTRWGIDSDEDGKVDTWKQISAEEVTEEVVAALRAKDAARFKRVLLTAEELKTLELPADQTTELGRKVSDAASAFSDVAKKQKLIDNSSKWVSFGGGKPGVVPATAGGKHDLTVYDNVAAMVETAGKQGQVAVGVGTLIQTTHGWRAIELPRLDDSDATPLAGYFFNQALSAKVDEATEGPAGVSPALQKLVAELEKIDKDLAASQDKAKLRKLNAERADLIEKIIDLAQGEDQDTWVKQYAETVTAAVQTGDFPDGIQRLKKLESQFAKAQPPKPEMVVFLGYRALQCDYNQSLKEAKESEIAKINSTWVEGLEKLVSQYANTQQAAEPLLSLAQEYEISGKEKEAIEAYGKIVTKYGDSEFAKKALGGKRRLESIGNRWMISGPTLDGKTNVSAASLAGKIVVVQYWATWCDQCKGDFDTLKKLQAKYGKQGLQVIGVNLDTDRADAQKQLKAATLPWPNLYEPGGFDSRYANEMGVFSLPLTILIDKQGKVLSRNITAEELDAEIRKQLK